MNARLNMKTCVAVCLFLILVGFCAAGEAGKDDRNPTEWVESVFNGPEDRKALKDLIVSITKDPVRFRNCLGAEHYKFLATRLKSTEEPVRFVARALSLIGMRERPPELLPDLLASVTESKNREDHRLMMVFGLMPVIEADRKPDALKTYFENLSKLQTMARSGLFSLYLRAGGDRGLVHPFTLKAGEMDPWKSLPEWFPGIDYWGELLGREPFTGAAPEKIKEQWKSYPKGMHSQLLRWLPTMPDTAEALWIVEQAIIMEAVKEDLLRTMWKMPADKQWSKAVGLRAWLMKTATDVKPKNTGHYATDHLNKSLAILAAGLLHRHYGDRETLDSTINAILEQDELWFLGWSTEIEVILACHPKHKTIEALLEHMKEPNKKGELNPGSMWRTWLIQVFRDEKAGEPPIRDLFAEINRRDSLPWLTFMRAHPLTFKKWVQKLRDPALVFAFKQGGDVERLIGTFDYVEMLPEK